MTRSGVVMLAMLPLAWSWAIPAAAQNDWQYPDPYFGILEIEKSRPSGSQSREAVRPAQPRSTARPRIWRMAPRPTGPVGRSAGAAGRPSGR